MGVGAPVVVSDQVGIHEDIARAKAGLVVPCEATKLADALVTLLSDRNLREALATGGEALARRYAPDVVTEQLVGMVQRHPRADASCWRYQTAMRMELVIEPGRSARNYWRDIWRYRELTTSLPGATSSSGTSRPLLA